MSHLPKFLLAQNRENTRQFVVHTQEPLCIAEIHDNKDVVELKGVAIAENNLEAQRIAGLMSRMGDWYYSVIKERSENENH
ncbi:MAG: hypothetical protein CVU11_13270 [Bacteroidetes bacterium HGW-Bacteroidetes-6]|jgi:hypothetical protein|nr:MAG: hypothetical protein CVU11_13270 [Bacteroidetes bacterium HGW-Bacteroidetes-6]